MRWVIASVAVAAVVGFALAYAIGGAELVAPVLSVLAPLLWGGIAVGLVLKVFRKPRSGDRTADRAALAEWESMYLGRKHAQPVFEERDPTAENSLVLDAEGLPPAFLPDERSQGDRSA